MKGDHIRALRWEWRVAIVAPFILPRARMGHGLERPVPDAPGFPLKTRGNDGLRIDDSMVQNHNQALT